MLISLKKTYAESLSEQRMAYKVTTKRKLSDAVADNLLN